jgi:hypothetical protein
MSIHPHAGHAPTRAGHCKRNGEHEDHDSSQGTEHSILQFKKVPAGGKRPFGSRKLDVGPVAGIPHELVPNQWRRGDQSAVSRRSSSALRSLLRADGTSGRSHRRVQCHGGPNERLQRPFIDRVALMEIDGTPGVAFEAGVEQA